MRSGVRLLAAAAVLLLAAATCGAQQGQLAADRPTGTFTREEVGRALEEVRKDPNLARERTITTLKWVRNGEQKKKRDSSGLAWLGELFAWLGQSGRFLFWAVLAALAGMLFVYLSKVVRTWRMPGKAERIAAPSFVRDLDIRPESLPDDIGAAAQQLWDRGEHRSALALLYRGLLSRLVHVHQVPIKDSSTEGDCIALTNRHLGNDERKLYVSNLVRVWQRAVYGGESVPTESVHALCEEFARALDPPEAAPANRVAAGANA